MSVNKSLENLSNALKKLEKASSSSSRKKAAAGGLPGQQDLFGGASGVLSKEEAAQVLQKIDHTIAAVQTLIQNERA